MKRKSQEREQRLAVQPRQDRRVVLSPETLRAIQRATEAARRLAREYQGRIK